MKTREPFIASIPPMGPSGRSGSEARVKARARQLFEAWLKGWEEGARAGLHGELTPLSDMEKVKEAALVVAQSEEAE